MICGTSRAARFLTLVVQINNSIRATGGHTRCKIKSTQMIRITMMPQLPLYRITFKLLVQSHLYRPHLTTRLLLRSPLISGMQSMQASPAPPVGSPYPYPFSHVRRNNTYCGCPIHTAPSSNYDPNHPSVTEGQLALQIQMHALNNHAALSDSTFSPSSTPFPGPG
ncbi:hypothetical protein DEU56DRAFT_822541 [Suillus clintonianus]|uniref:uncharacterized protein n=1 Tax=Suillus clintonianus TaxID=1904413 RepID=UPI001B8616BF|nr:uncharacterized protein DEU56DRAFT_822541 [Suillus clintonianus]KAG2126268.1 hypothetical protein DEU56DRAFT_822541 [Suillus clintonianus]